MQHDINFYLILHTGYFLEILNKNYLRKNPNCRYQQVKNMKVKSPLVISILEINETILSFENTYKFIFYSLLFLLSKTEVQTISLKCWTGLKLNWFKSYETNQKHMTQANISHPKPIHHNWKAKKVRQANYSFVYVGSKGSPRRLNKQRTNLRVLLKVKGPKRFIPLFAFSTFFKNR